MKKIFMDLLPQIITFSFGALVMISFVLIELNDFEKSAKTYLENTWEREYVVDEGSIRDEHLHFYSDKKRYLLQRNGEGSFEVELH